MKKMTLMGAVLLAASCSFAHAAEEGAGCGLGASVMEGKGGKGTNIAAAILNDYLNVLASLLGVPETELPRFSSLAQSQFDTLFLDGNQASDVISSLQVAMSSDQHLAPFALN